MVSNNDYRRIAKAITFLADNINRQPTLDEVAAHVHLSAFHFQRLFCQWAGITPKRFLQVMTLDKAKGLIADGASLAEAGEQTGLSSTSRLYDHFVTLDAVTPGEFKLGGASLVIDYGVHPGLFGDLLLACTPRGICKAVFVDIAGLDDELTALQQEWPLATLHHNPQRTLEYAAQVSALLHSGTSNTRLPLTVRGTNFQVAVWRALLQTASGDSLSYSELARRLGRPQSVRAVANAVAANPVALLIPCHRVIRDSGALSGYRWGIERKRLLRFYEKLQADTHINETVFQSAN